MADDDALVELLYDSESDTEFEGFSQEDVRLREARRIAAEEDVEVSSVSSVSSESDSESDRDRDEHVPHAYDHDWLNDFASLAGPRNIPDDISEVGLFQLYFSDDLIDMIVTETNRYAVQMTQKFGGQALPHSRYARWRPTTRPEMKAFLALLLLMGVSKRSSYALYWSTDPLLEMPGFRKVMARDRFLAILTFFHLNNNEEALPRDDPQHDKIHKFRPLIDMLLPLWQRYFVPAKEVSVDESMIPFKGRTHLMQYMPAKPNKWGLKAWGLADSKTGYMWNWSLYTGKDNQRPQGEQPGLAHRVVTQLAAPLYNRGHVLYMDNFFSSPTLFQELADNQMGACGTFRLNRRGVPDRAKQAKPTARDPPMTTREGNILYISWFDKRQVNLMTSAHSSQTFRKEVRSKHHPDNVRIVQKPAAIHAYTQHMGGIDRADKQMTYYMVLHRSVKWWKKVFFYLLEVSYCNALVIHKALQGRRVSAEKFRLAIAHGLMEGYEPDTSGRAGRRPANPPPERLIMGSHYIAITTQQGTGRPSYPDCVVCSDRRVKRHQTQYKCRQCNVNLCPYPCFERYHSGELQGSLHPTTPQAINR